MDQKKQTEYVYMREKLHVTPHGAWLTKLWLFQI